MHPAAAPSLPWPAMCPAAPPTTAPLMHPLASAAPTEASARATAQIAADVGFMRFSDSKYRGLNSLRDTRFLAHQAHSRARRRTLSSFPLCFSQRAFSACDQKAVRPLKLIRL